MTHLPGFTSKSFTPGRFLASPKYLVIVTLVSPSPLLASKKKKEEEKKKKNNEEHILVSSISSSLLAVVIQNLRCCSLLANGEIVAEGEGQEEGKQGGEKVGDGEEGGTERKDIQYNLVLLVL